MSDNVTIDNGDETDFVASTDDAGAAGHVQRVKLTYSADGSATHVPADADGLLVNLGANNDVVVTSLPALVAGTAAIGKLAANSGVDIGDVDVTSVVPGTGASNLGKAEDAAHGSGDVGVMPLAVRRDTAVASSGADGDYEPLQTDAEGYLRTAGKVLDSTGAEISFSSPVVVTATPSIDAGAYAANDNLDGAIISFANAVAVSGGVGHILAASFLVKSDVAPEIDLYLLDASITPEAQNAAFTMSDADAEKVVAVIHTTAGTWEDLVASRKNMQEFGPPKPFKVASGTTLFAVAVTRDAYTPGSTSDLVISLLIQPD